MGHSGAQRLRNPEILIFITSPDRITPLHFDAEVNFLVQIASSKNLWVCDANDRTVTTEAELEVYHACDIPADHYRPRVNTEAHHFSRSR
ncbi:hypothetical protein ABIE45_003786 [Methylobacterium sp. OAE515]